MISIAFAQKYMYESNAKFVINDVTQSSDLTIQREQQKVIMKREKYMPGGITDDAGGKCSRRS